ncbi:MAG TPA: SRPBCC family protein [Caulobacteraceae bacterium]|nr:SRPBCC family protein [Caulobacteraceae bacterium]
MTNRIEKTVEIDAPVERVWEALTDHRQFGTWFRVDLHDPFVVGQTTRGQMTYPGFEHYPWESRTEVMDRPRLFAFLWPHAEPGEDTANGAWTRCEFRLDPVGERTRLTIVESGFEALPESRRAEALRSNEGGWEEQARNIKTHVEAPERLHAKG